MISSNDSSDATTASSSPSPSSTPAPFLVDSHCHIRVFPTANAFPSSKSMFEAATSSSPVSLVCATSPTTDWKYLSLLANAVSSRTVSQEEEEQKQQEKRMIRVGFGIHPWWANEISSKNWEEHLCQLLEQFPQAIVGEIGLDKIKSSPSSPAKVSNNNNNAQQREGEGEEGDFFSTQIKVFETQLNIAAKYKRPVSVHCVRAWGQMQELLAKRSIENFPPAFIFHGYTGSAEFAKGVLKLSKGRGSRFFFGIGASTTGSLKGFSAELFKVIPRDRILIESDEFVNSSPEETASAREKLWSMAKRLEEVAGVTEEDLMQNFLKVINF